MMVFAIIHELGHMISGILLGLKIEKMELMPYGVSVSFRLTTKDYNNKIKNGNLLELKKIIVAIAGPLTNLLIAIITYYLDIGEEFKPSREMTNGKCLALFANPEEGMTLVPNEARFICDPEYNPCYNAAQARRGSLALLITPGNVSTHMLHYILDNKMLPDAALLSAKDATHGKCLVQENMDFIARFMRTVDY